MKTEELINKLSTDLPPVSRIFPLPIAFAGWMLFVFFYLFAFVWIRSDNFQFIHVPKYFYETIPVILVFMFSAYLSMYTSIPGNRLKKGMVYTPALLLLSWVLLLFLRYFLFDPYNEPVAYQYHGCIYDFLLISLPSAIVLLIIINKRVPVLKSWVGFWILAASSTTSALAVDFLCPNEAPSHLLVVHLLPVFCVSLPGLVLGNFLLKKV